jgi:hypothetical protein
MISGFNAELLCRGMLPFQKIKPHILQAKFKRDLHRGYFCAYLRA